MSVRAKADLGLAILDGQADAWAESINLTSMIKDATSPMDLTRSAPDVVRLQFRQRMEARIDELVRHAFKEGMFRAITGLIDEKAARERTAPAESNRGAGRVESPRQGQR